MSGKILGDWLKTTNRSTDDFGKEIKVSGATVRRYVLGTRRPRDPIRVRIRNATHGAVPIESWTNPDDGEGGRAFA